MNRRADAWIQRLRSATHEEQRARAAECIILGHEPAGEQFLTSPPTDICWWCFAGFRPRLTDVYRLVCFRCSLDQEFLISRLDGGSDLAVDVARRRHAEAGRGCPDDRELRVELREAGMIVSFT
jgi:hypothetical protein